MPIQSNERIFLCGKTGSGKTFMARYLARKLHRFIVFDPKVKLDIKAWNLVDATPTGLRNFERGDSLRIRLTPTIESPGQFWIENAQRIFESGRSEERRVGKECR